MFHRLPDHHVLPLGHHQYHITIGFSRNIKFAGYRRHFTLTVRRIIPSCHLIYLTAGFQTDPSMGHAHLSAVEGAGGRSNRRSITSSPRDFDQYPNRQIFRFSNQHVKRNRRAQERRTPVGRLRRGRACDRLFTTAKYDRLRGLELLYPPLAVRHCLHSPWRQLLIFP